MSDTPRCDALGYDPLDSNDHRAWRTLALQLERELRGSPSAAASSCPRRNSCEPLLMGGMSCEDCPGPAQHNGPQLAMVAMGVLIELHRLMDFEQHVSPGDDFQYSDCSAINAAFDRAYALVAQSREHPLLKREVEGSRSSECISPSAITSVSPTTPGRICLRAKTDGRCTAPDCMCPIVKASGVSDG